MIPSQNLPTESGKAGDFARMLVRALGPAIQAAQSTVTGALFLAFGDALAAVYATVSRSADQAFTTSATDLLPQLETEYGLERRPDLSNADRQARLTAKVRAARAGTDQGIVSAISAVDPDASILGVTCLEAAGVGAPRKTFYFTVLTGQLTLDDTTTRALIDQIVAQMKPAHTLGLAASGQPFEVSNATLGRLNLNTLG